MSELITVMLVILIVWLGLACWLFRTERRISALEREINED